MSGARAGVETSGAGRGHPARSPHYPALDGIRGVAVLSVMVYHFFLFGEMVPRGLVDHLPAAIASAGWAGVDLFFVLSGFLITGILLDSRADDRFFSTFYTRRVLRIFPLYYGVLVVFFIMLPLAFPAATVIQGHTGGQLWSWTYLSNVQLAVYGWGATSPFIDHFWSLAVEEQFYLFWPILVFLLSRRDILRVCGLIVAGSFGLRWWLHANGLETAAFVLTPARMDALAIGSVVAIAVRSPQVFRDVKRGAPPVLAVSTAMLAAICLWRGGMDKNDAVVATVGFTLLSFAFGCVIVLAITALPNSPLFRLLTARPLRALGKYSYALYIFHQPVALVLTTVGISAATVLPMFSIGLPGQLLYGTIAFTISLVAAVLSWHLYEKHFLKLKEHFRYGRGIPLPSERVEAAYLPASDSPVRGHALTAAGAVARKGV